MDLGFDFDSLLDGGKDSKCGMFEVEQPDGSCKSSVDLTPKTDTKKDKKPDSKTDTKPAAKPDAKPAAPAKKCDFGETLQPDGSCKFCFDLGGEQVCV